MKIKLRFLAILATFALLLVPLTALAQPIVPLQYEGNVTIGGNPAPIGTIISAEIGVDEVATNAPAGIDGEGYYRIDVPAHQGDEVVLKVSGVVGGQATHPDPMSTWHVACPLATYTLTVNVDPLGGGTVALNPDQAAYPSVDSTTVTLDPQPASGYQFNNWTGALTGSADPATLVIDANKAVTAHFASVAPTEYTITFDTDPEATGSITFDGVSYTDGNTVDKAADTYSIVAHPGSGYTFDSWETTGGLSVTAASSATTTCVVSGNGTLRMVQTIVPPIYYTLTVTCDPTAGGSVSLNPSQPVGGYAAGTSVELTATPEDGYAFGSWSGDMSGSSNPDSITMSSNKSVTANFVEFSAPGNVDVSEADPGVENINVTTKDLAEVDTTNMPEDVEAQEAYVVSPTGTGSFTLRFTGISNASNIVLYKVVGITWTQIPITAITVIDATTVEVTMEVGDPILVFGLPTGAPAPSPGVGGTAYPPNKLLVLAPWIALGLAIIAGAAIFVRRRRAQS